MRTRLLTAASVGAATLFTVAGGAAAHDHHNRRHGRDAGAQFSASVFAAGATITHPITGGSEPVSHPDDITYLNGEIFVAFQNGVGAQGQPTGTTADSTIVAFSRDGSQLAQWDITGKCDGLAADPQTGQLIATVNEDANSSLYVIDPVAGSTPVQYQYNVPLPSDGGTDAISVYHGTVLISASAPGTTAPMGAPAAPQASYPAVYRVWLDSSTDTAYIDGLFGDEAPALTANTGAASFGSLTTLGLTDPDSNAVVPRYADRFAGDFMLSSQGDQQQIFYRDPWQPLSVLSLPASADDTAWPSDGDGTLYTTDNAANQIIAVTGPFARGSEIAAVTPCDSNLAPAVCPGPGYPPKYLGAIDPFSGAITPLSVGGTAFAPQGLLFLPDRRHG
ncbi:MAG: hypothetical protein KGL15_00485 [Acidobacteriota bacterium]|nr:hypothetical protein [Acidobacteriota bacterium]